MQVGERVVAAFHSRDVRTSEFRVDIGGEIVNTNLAGLPGNAELGDRPLLESRTVSNRMNVTSMESGGSAALEQLVPVDVVSSSSSSTRNRCCISSGGNSSHS